MGAEDGCLSKPRRIIDIPTYMLLLLYSFISLILQTIWPYSGHYLPTKDNFKEFFCFLEELHVNLTNVERYATNDDSASSIVRREEPQPEMVDGISTSAISTDAEATDANESINDAIPNTAGSSRRQHEHHCSQHRKHQCSIWLSVCLANGQVELGRVLGVSGTTQQSYNPKHLSKSIYRLGFTPSPTGRCVPIDLTTRRSYNPKFNVLDF